MFRRFSWTPASQNRNNMTLAYEPLQPYIFLASLRRLGSTIVFDVGANIGQYSVFAASLSRIERVYAFEAEQVAYTQLVENIRLNEGGRKIDPRFVAVSDADGEIEFGVAGSMAGNNAIVSTSIHDVTVFKERRTIPAIALDNEFKIVNGNLGFKIDVEGHEAAVINGAKKLLTNNMCLIQVEIYRGQESVMATLEGMGYDKFFRAGPDNYFTNDSSLLDSQTIINLLEEAAEDLINYNLKG